MNGNFFRGQGLKRILTNRIYIGILDADTYFNLSLAGRSEISVNIELHWIDDDDNYYYTDTGEDFKAVARDIGSIDLSALSQGWSGDVKKVWFEFSGTNLTINVRIGWIKLTE